MKLQFSSTASTCDLEAPFLGPKGKSDPSLPELRRLPPSGSDGSLERLGHGRSEPALPVSQLAGGAQSGSKAAVDMDISALPNLVDRLQEAGLYREYVARKEQQRRRSSGKKGLGGRVTRRALSEWFDMSKHEQEEELQIWYPTVRAYNFRRSISFWVATTCLEGCLLSLWHSFAVTFPIGPTWMMYELTRVPNLLAGFCFVFGLYLGWFQLVNLEHEKIHSGKFSFLLFSWRSLEEHGVERASWVGMLFYIVGAFFCSVARFADFGTWDPVWQDRLVAWPFILGGFSAFCGGCCGLVVNNVFFSPPNTIVWFVAVLNWYAGLVYWLSSCPSFVTGRAATLMGASGTMAYFLTSIMGLCMWRGEQFGGALLPALNRVSEVTLTLGPVDAQGRQTVVAVGINKTEVKDVLNPRLSWRGLAFLMVFVGIGAFQMLSCCTTLSHHGDYTKNPLVFKRALNAFLSGFINTIIVHLSLALTSLTLTLPKLGDEPYRTMAIVMRIAAVVLFLNSMLTLDVQFETEAAAAMS